MLVVCNVAAGASTQEAECRPAASVDDKWYESWSEALRNADKVYKLKIDLGNLQRLAAAKDQFHHLCSLRLRCHRRDSIGPAIGRLKSLRYLNLSGNGLRVLPDEITELRHLRHLNLRGNKLTGLPDSLGRLRELRYIGLGDNKLKRLPASIVDLVNLEMLEFEVSEQEELPTDLGRLRSLRILRIAGRRMKRLPASIGQLSNLRVLQFRDVSIKALPPSIGNLRSLEELWIWSDTIPRLPASIGDLPSLRKIFLSGVNRAALPDELSRLPELRELTIFDHRLREIPAAWADLPRVEYLYFKVDSTCRIPPAFYELPRLRRLTFNGRRSYGRMPGFFGGIHYSRNWFIEVGWTDGYEPYELQDLMPHSWTPQGLRFALEVRPGDNGMLGAKLAWMEVAAIFTGSAHLIYYTDFHGQSIRLRPEIGLMLRGARLAGGLNLPLFNRRFDGVSLGSLSIQINLHPAIFD